MPELTDDEYRNAWEVFHNQRGTVTVGGRNLDLTLGQIEDLLVRAWKFDASRWPPATPTGRDIVFPSPNGRFACVLYSCDEIGLYLTAGLLTVLHAPRENPEIIFQPRSFRCACDGNSVQWLCGGRYCVFVAYYALERETNRIRAEFTFLDLEQRRIASEEITELGFLGQAFDQTQNHWLVKSRVDASGRCQQKAFVPDQLRWGPWIS